jgi:hypothetical protein
MTSDFTPSRLLGYSLSAGVARNPTKEMNANIEVKTGSSTPFCTWMLDVECSMFAFNLTANLVGKTRFRGISMKSRILRRPTRLFIDILRFLVFARRFLTTEDTERKENADLSLFSVTSVPPW